MTPGVYTATETRAGGLVVDRHHLLGRHGRAELERRGQHGDVQRAVGRDDHVRVHEHPGRDGHDRQGRRPGRSARTSPSPATSAPSRSMTAARRTRSNTSETFTVSAPDFGTYDVTEGVLAGWSLTDIDMRRGRRGRGCADGDARRRSGRRHHLHVHEHPQPREDHGGQGADLRRPEGERHVQPDRRRDDRGDRRQQRRRQSAVVPTG